MSISIRISELIDKLSLSISQFERQIGVSQSRISKIIKRDSEVSTDVVQRILDNFPEVNANWLISGEGKMLKESQTFHVISEDVSDIELYIPSDSSTEIVKLNAFDKILLIPHVSAPLYSFLLNNLDSDNLRTILPKYALFSTHGASFQWSEHMYALSIFDDSLNDGETQNYEPGDVLITHMHKELPYAVAKDKFYVVITKQKEVLVRKLELTDNLDIVKMIAANTKIYSDRTIHRDDVAMVFSVQQAILMRTPRL